MSLNLNKVILAGRLVADPELKQTNSGSSVTSFTIAVDRKYNKGEEKKCDFITIVAWKQTAEFICKYFGKGQAILICGELQTRSWQDQQGNKRYATEVVADEAMFVDSKNEGGVSGGQYSPDAYATPSYSSAPTAAPKFEELKTDEDLPF